MSTKVQHALPFVFAIIVYCSDSAASTGTFDGIDSALQSGRLNDAQAMIGVVLREEPNSAVAHFVDAQILAQQGRLDYATTELQAAQRLSPGLPFAKPYAVAALEEQLRKIDVGTAFSELPLAEYKHVRNLLWSIVIAGIALTIAAFLVTRRTPHAAIRGNPNGARSATDDA